MSEDLARRIAAQLAGRQDRTLAYLQLAISHKLVPSPERWFGKNDPGFSPLLGPGMHRMAVEDLRRLVVDQFPESDTRPRLWDAVNGFRRSLARCRVAAELWIGGSLVSEKPDPRDVDVVVVLLTERIIVLSPEEAWKLEKVLAGAKASGLELAIMFEGDLALRAYLQGLLGFREDRVRSRGIAVLPLTGP